MSNLINKVKSSMHRDDNTSSSNNAQYDNPRSSNEGPHGSNMLNKADPRVDSDGDHRNNPSSVAGGYGNTHGATTTGGGYNSSPGYNTSPAGSTGYNTGAPGSTHHPRDSGYSGGSGYSSGSNTAGPHNSNLANKVDPRVDSDLSQQRKPVGGTTSGSPGYGNTGNTGYGTGSSGYSAPTGTAVGSGAPGYGGNQYDNRGTTGPHDSNIANKLDPRVDASRTDDHTTHSTAKGTMEHDTRHTGAGQGSSNVSNTIGTGQDKMTHSTRHEGGGAYDSSAVHRSDAGHVDSSKTHHSGPGIHESSTTTGHNAAGATTSTTHTSTHSSGGSPANVGGNQGIGNQGYGNEPGYGRNTTDGPHNSNVLNKLDPRVDSDRSQQARRY